MKCCEKLRYVFFWMDAFVPMMQPTEYGDGYGFIAIIRGSLYSTFLRVFFQGQMRSGRVAYFGTSGHRLRRSAVTCQAI